MGARRRRQQLVASSRQESHVCVSPFGAANHAPAQKIATTISPMKGAHLQMLVYRLVTRILDALYPFAMAAAFVGARRNKVFQGNRRFER
jgi:hypothetical protein